MTAITYRPAMGLDDLAAQIRAAAAMVRAADTAAERAHGQAEQLTDGFAALGADGQAGKMAATGDQLGEARAVAGAMLVKLGEALAAVERAKAHRGGGSGLAASASPEPSRPTLPPPPRPDMRQAQVIRAHVGKPKTVGQLTVGGEPVGGEIWSGRDGPGQGGPGLAEPWRRMETMTMHTEGHAAAVMRRDGHRDAVLYITRPPCDYLPDGCDARLRDVIPAGSRLTVYTVNRGGGASRRIYDGNGKGLLK